MKQLLTLILLGFVATDLKAAELIRGARPDERRMDAVLKDTSGGEEIWVDVTVRHPTCARYVRRERRNPGIALKEAVTLKNRTYGDLLRAAHQEHVDNRRACKPAFHVAAMTTLGQYGEQFEVLIEKIVRHRDSLGEGPRMDGKSPAQVILEFRQNFKTDLIFAMVRGNALMINRAGRPRSFLRSRWIRA